LIRVDKKQSLNFFMKSILFWQVGTPMENPQLQTKAILFCCWHYFFLFNETTPLIVGMFRRWSLINVGILIRLIFTFVVGKMSVAVDKMEQRTMKIVNSC
jgi:hypothetical protein